MIGIVDCLATVAVVIAFTGLGIIFCLHGIVLEIRKLVREVYNLNYNIIGMKMKKDEDDK